MLEGVADRLGFEARPGDLCCRIGGHEFALALVNSDVSLATKILGRIAAAVAGLEFGPARDAVSLSAGVAEFPCHSVEAGGLMRCADRALYRAKAIGRDTVFPPA